MKIMTLAALSAVLIAAPQVTQAQGFLDSINSIVNQVDKTITTGEKAQRTTDRIMDKVPQKEAGQGGAEATQDTSNASAPEVVEPSSGSISAAEEDEILRKAREIEERRILQEAERIRERRASEYGDYSR